MRLSPLPEVDHTLVIRGVDLSELVDGTRRVCTLSVTPAAVELLELQASVGGRREGVLAVRVVGGRERSEAEEAVLRASLAGSHELTRLLPAEADALWRDVRDLEEGAELVLRFSNKPARIGDLIGLAQGLLEGSGKEERRGCGAWRCMQVRVSCGLRCPSSESASAGTSGGPMGWRTLEAFL